jgi:hypothetical protein
MSYDLTSDEMYAACKWIKRHSCDCEYRKTRVLGVDVDHYELRIREHGIGHTVIVACDCGATQDVTDVGAW